MKYSGVFGLASLLSTVLAAPTSLWGSRSLPEERSANLDITKLLTAIANTFPVNVAVADVCGVLTAGEQALGATFGLSSTANSGSSCTDVTLLFARGTCDPGNVGVLVGPPFINALKSALGSKSLNVQGLNYAATVSNYVNHSPADGQAMAALISSTVSACPNTKIVLGGYSQGGYAVHDGAANVGAAAMSHVSAVVVFGDPESSQPVANIDQSKVRIVCHPGDDICQAGDIILPQHLTYAADAASAASFVASKL